MYRMFRYSIECLISGYVYNMCKEVFLKDDQNAGLKFFALLRHFDDVLGRPLGL